MNQEEVTFDLLKDTLHIPYLEKIISALNDGKLVHIKNCSPNGVTLAEIYSYLIREGIKRG